MVYSEVRPEDMSLRDHLALDRTVLANERTLLSYMRTAFGFVAGGVTLVKLFPDDAILVWLGFLLVVIGGSIAILGLGRFVVVSRRLKTILTPPAAAESESPHV